MLAWLVDRVDTSVPRLDYLGHVAPAVLLEPERRRRLVLPVVVRDEVRLKLARARDGAGPRAVLLGAGRADADQPLSAPGGETQAVAGERGPGRLLDLLLEVEVGKLLDEFLCGFDLGHLLSEFGVEEQQVRRRQQSQEAGCHGRDTQDQTTSVALRDFSISPEAPARPRSMYRTLTSKASGTNSSIASSLT